MKRIMLLVSLNTFLTFGAISQQISRVNFDLIKTRVEDKHSTFYYPALIERFNKADTTLTEEEFDCIYYGNTLHKNYAPYSESDAEKKFMEVYEKEKYDKAIPLGEKVLKENPVNLQVLFTMLVCYHMVKDTAQKNAYRFRYFNLLESLYRSGDGKTCETSIVVIKVSDEYQILYDLELTSRGQALIGDCDKLTMNDPKDNEPKELFFNVSKPFEYLSSMFKKDKK